MNSQLNIIPVKSDDQIQETAILANEIWHQHFPPIIGQAQVEYMVDKFQSFRAIKDQIAGGYEYFQFIRNNSLVGYTGIHEEDGKLFLSKLYLKHDIRGQHLSTEALNFLKELCRERSLSAIWLTCNRHNSHTLAVYDHFGFQVIREEVTDVGSGYVMDDYIMELTL